MKLLELFNQKLLEYNRNYLLRTYGDKINKIVLEKEDSIKNVDEFLNELDNFIRKNYDSNTIKILDPYIKWIVDRYSKNNIRNLDEIKKSVLNDLIIFDKIKKSQKNSENMPKDINQIKSSDHLKEIVSKLSSIKTKREKYKEKEKYLIDNDLAEIIYDDPKVKFIKIKDFSASCFYGVGTRWCVSMTDANNKERGKSYFDYYIDKGDLYVIIDKINSKKYLTSFYFKKTRDENDLPVDLEKFKEENPYLYNKFLDLFKTELIKHEYIEMLPSNFEILNNDHYLKTLIKRSFFSENNIKYDTDPTEIFLKDLDNIGKENSKNLEKILNKFSDILSEYISDKNNQEIFNIHNYYVYFLKRLSEKNIKIPEKLKKLSENILKYYDEKLVPKIYFKIVKNL